jgi:hypothetical protein
MGVILGTMTQVDIQGVTDGFQSINWNINRQPNRLWQLGNWYPWRTQVGSTVTISVTAYAGALGTQELRASTACEISPASRHIIINAESCDPATSVNVDYQNMFITSYSYSKGDPIGFGTESWSFQKWIESGVGGNFLQIPEPTYILQGTSEGNRSGNVADLGLVFFSDAEAGGSHIVTGQQGSVSAGFPGIGNADAVEIGLVKQIGGGSLEHGGKTGQSSVTVPHTPLYIG